MESKSCSIIFVLLLIGSIEVIKGDVFGTVQSASVRGTLMCDGKPAVGIKVKLYDQDTLDLDDLMDEGVTDENGKFVLKGKEKEHTTIDPKVNVYHNCNDKGSVCSKKFSIMIPQEYVTEGEIAQKTFDIGSLNLNGEFSGETRDCIN